MMNLNAKLFVMSLSIEQMLQFPISEALVIPAVMVAFIMLLPMLAIMSIVLIVNSVRHKDKLIFLDIFDLMVCLVMAYILISNA